MSWRSMESGAGMAPRDIPPGADYGDVIDEAIVACRLFVLVFSEPGVALAVGEG